MPNTPSARLIPDVICFGGEKDVAAAETVAHKASGRVSWDSSKRGDPSEVMVAPV